LHPEGFYENPSTVSTVRTSLAFGVHDQPPSFLRCPKVRIRRETASPRE
jgi:hypothetical protein